MAREKGDRARRKGGGKGSPLIFPFLAFAEQQPVAEQWTQHAKGGRGAAVIFRVLDQDVVNPLGPVENDLLTAEKAADDHVFFKGLRRECQKGVLPQRLGDVPPGQPSGPRASRRTENWLHLAPRPYPKIAEPMPQRSGSSRLVPSAALSPRGAVAPRRSFAKSASLVGEPQPVRVIFIAYLTENGSFCRF